MANLRITHRLMTEEEIEEMDVLVIAFPVVPRPSERDYESGRADGRVPDDERPSGRRS